MLKEFFSLIFPQNCLKCSQSLNSGEDFLCTGCKIDLPITQDWTNPHNDLFRKFAFEPKIKSAMSYLYYHRGGISQKLIYALKYNGKKEIGTLLGKWMAQASMLQVDTVDYLIPVPLHRSKHRRRTYNQSEVIAASFGEHSGIELNTTMAKRVVATKSQTRKSKVERWSNMENVYGEISEDLTDKSILILDDVITTGATVGMLCDRLIAANAKEIHIICAARGK